MLREQFKPKRVSTLFVGESSPAGGTYFYRANSNLFRATQAGFSAALGDVVPSGPRFLHWFQDQGCWLVDLADCPVNCLDGLAELIRQEHPDRIIVVKASIAPAVRQSAATANFDGTIVQLPFPVRQWRNVYIRDLAKAFQPE